MTSARRVALVALKKWRTARQFADSIIASLLAESTSGQPERAFAMELFYGVLRNLTLLDFWIRELRTTPVGAELRDLLRLGLYQLLLLETAPHAAVFETVELAALKQRPLVNGVLRAALRRRAQLEEYTARQSLDVRFSHPLFLIERWQSNFGSSVGELCQWNNQPPPIYARINQLKISPAAFLSRYREAENVSGRENFVQFSRLQSIAIQNGECYVQDPGTTMACDLLDPKPDENILDACAAPGGKTGYLAEKMRNRGRLLACDRDPDRLKTLRDNLSQLGIAIASVTKQNWEKAQVSREIRSSAPFDRILIDAPCSNTGVIRRRVDVRWRLRPGDFLRMQQRQVKIAQAVANLLKPGGTLVHSTCSIEPEENEEVAKAIERTTTLRLEAKQQLLPFQDHFDGAFAARFVKNR